MTWLFGSSKKKLPPISGPVPLASQSALIPSKTKSLAALRQERIAAGRPIIPKSKAPGPLLGGFNRFLEAFQKLDQPPARPTQNIYKPRHGSQHRHRHQDGSHHRRHHRDGSGPEKKASKHHHRREHRGQREQRLQQEAEDNAGKGKHTSSTSSPGLQAPQPVHVRRAHDPLPDTSPLSRQIRDLQGMLPSTHQRPGPDPPGRPVPEVLNSSAAKGKQRAGEPALCRLCSKRAEYRPGNGLCEACMRLAFTPVADLRLPFSEPTASRPDHGGECDPSDPARVRPRERAASPADTNVAVQDQRREREPSTARNAEPVRVRGGGPDKYEPIAWRRQMGAGPKDHDKKRTPPTYLTHTRSTIRARGPALLEESPFNVPARAPAPAPSAHPSIWTDVKCTDVPPPPRHHHHHHKPPSTPPDHRNPTVAAATTAYNALHRFRAELAPTDTGDKDAEPSRTGYTSIINAYAGTGTTAASISARAQRCTPCSPPSPSVYPPTLVFDDRDARRNFDPLHPGFFDGAANPWFHTAAPEVEAKPKSKSKAGAGGRPRGDEKPKEKPRRDDRVTNKEREAENTSANPSQGHYTDRHGRVLHLAPAHGPYGVPVGKGAVGWGAGLRGKAGARRERGRVTDLGEFTGRG